MDNTSKFYSRLNDIQAEIGRNEYGMARLFIIMRELIDEAEQDARDLQDRLTAAESELGRIESVLSAENESCSPKEKQHPYMLVQRLINELREANRTLEHRTNERDQYKQQLEEAQRQEPVRYYHTNLGIDAGLYTLQAIEAFPSKYSPLYAAPMPAESVPAGWYAYENMSNPEIFRECGMTKPNGPNCFTDAENFCRGFRQCARLIASKSQSVEISGDSITRIIDNLQRIGEKNILSEPDKSVFRQTLEILKHEISVESDEPVYLVATGEHYGQHESYTLHGEPPPLCDYEKLYRRASPNKAGVPEGYVHVDEVIQLCKDFSSRTGSIYIGDVQAALSSLPPLKDE